MSARHTVSSCSQTVYGPVLTTWANFSVACERKEIIKSSTLEKRTELRK